MNKYKELNVKELIDILKTIDKNKKVFISSDEECNTIFKKFVVFEDNEFVALAGLSGTELEV
jgi:predicted glycosyltransferase